MSNPIAPLTAETATWGTLACATCGRPTTPEGHVLVSDLIPHWRAADAQRGRKLGKLRAAEAQAVMA